MEFEERKTKPESTRKFLIQQVEEQSEFCDVTVKMGLWEKRFHKCVLGASPFFNRMLKNDFIEKQTGELEVTIGTPASLEMAVMFLYGKKPILTHQNVDQIVEMAEFLLIPNLKAACVSWLKVVDITEDNCMKYLQLASIYEFDMPNCVAYIQGHMSKMLQHSQMLNLTNDSVEYLFSDITLSYVTLEKTVRFIARWVKTAPESRTESAMEICKCIYFEHASPSLLEELRLDATLNNLIDFGDITGSTGDNSNLHSVLLLRENNTRSFTCFDLKRERWFRFDSALQKGTFYSHRDIVGVRPEHSEIYILNKKYRDYTILKLNLETDESISQRVLLNDNEDIPTFSSTSLNADVLVGCANVQRKRNNNMETDLQTYIEQHPYLLSVLGGCSENHLMEVAMHLSSRTGYTNHSVLYMAHVSETADIVLSPILTVLNEKIDQVCVNEKSAVAMVDSSRLHVILFDLLEYKMEKVELETEYNDKLVATDDGFLLHNNKRCISIVWTTGSTRSERLVVTEVELENIPNSSYTYNFCANTWFRYFRRDYKDSFKFECARHVDVITASCPDGVIWKRLPLPKEDSQCYAGTISDRFIQICLSKGKLRCNLECPHCKMTKATDRQTYPYRVTDDDSDYYYNDSSDDDYCGYNDSPDDYYGYYDSPDDDNYVCFGCN